MRLVLALVALVGGAPFALHTNTPDTVTFCVRGNCTVVAFVPSMVRTSLAVTTTQCTATLRVYYDCTTQSGALDARRNLAPLIDECDYVEHVVHDNCP